MDEPEAKPKGGGGSAQGEAEGAIGGGTLAGLAGLATHLLRRPELETRYFDFCALHADGADAGAPPRIDRLPLPASDSALRADADGARRSDALRGKVRHNYAGHNCMGHSYIGHNDIGHEQP